MINFTNFLNGHTDGFQIFTYHLKKSLTWYWGISWRNNRDGFRQDFFKIVLAPKEFRKGQYSHRLYLFGKGFISISFQDYHKKSKV